MSNAHPRPWHRGSLFGPGPRQPLDRDQRARFRFLLNAHRRAHRLTPHAELIGNALVRRLGVDGQCDPSHDTLAADVGCCTRTVRRALVALKAVGLVMWQCRLVRDGWRTAQTSSAYLLMLNSQIVPAVHCGGQSGRQIRKLDLFTVPEASAAETAAAQAALARRRAAVEQGLLMKGRVVDQSGNRRLSGLRL
jgi:hypothetical protein